jgi:hypothetical protein
MTDTDPLRESLKSVVRTAQLLQQNAEGCAVNHHVLDFEEQGLPGWLRDTKASIDAACAALALLPAAPDRGPLREAIRETIADEWGSHLCYTSDGFGNRICDKDKHCRCADIARAVVSQHAIPPADALTATPVAWRYKCHDGSFVVRDQRLTDDDARRGYYTGGEDDDDGEAFAGPFKWSEETPLYVTSEPMAGADRAAVIEEAGKIIDPYAWTDPDNMSPTERFVREKQLPGRREEAISKAKEILAFASARNRARQSRALSETNHLHQQDKEQL